MRKVFTHLGVRWVIDGPLTDRVRRLMHTAQLGLRELKARSGDGVDVMRYEVPGRYVATSVHGLDTIYLEGVEVAGEIIEEEEFFVTETEEYVLLVEMGNWHYQDHEPQQFAVFTMGGEGHSPRGSMAVNLSFDGVETGMEESTSDPPGLVGQETFRVKWCKGGSPPPSKPYTEEDVGVTSEVEQVCRVDGGYLAYDGDEDIEEVTELYNTNNVWSYEDIEYTTQWHSVEPGPPPEAVCGYTWAWWEAYGPGGDDDADFHTRRYLFYMIEYGSFDPKKYQYHWPPEFYQHQIKTSRWRENTMLYRTIDMYDEGWDTCDIVGFEAALSHIMLPEGYSRRSTVVEDSNRWGGVIYGTGTSPLTDAVNRSDTHPFLNCTPVKDWWVRTWDINRGKIWDAQDGVYIKDRWQELFIQGLQEYPAGSEFSGTDYIYVEERAAQDPSDRFTQDYIDTKLTDEAKELMEGNSDAYDWNGGNEDNPPHLPRRNYAEAWDRKGLGNVSVNVGGEIYYTYAMESYGTVWSDYLREHVHRVTSSRCKDYGIFTKTDTGIDEDGEVDAETIDPIYAYSVIIYGDTDAQDGIIYGMVIDGKHYKTDIFPFIEPSVQSVTMFRVPGAGDGSGGKTSWGLYCTHRVRVGVKKTTIIRRESDRYEVE